MGFDGGTGEDLQQLLDDPLIPIVELKIGSIWRLTGPVTIPPGKILQTNTLPGTASYGKMGRIVRAAGPSGSFRGPAIEIESGATMRNVWYDGQLGTYTSPFWVKNEENGQPAVPASNVVTRGGGGTAVQNNRLGNSRGLPAPLRVEGNWPWHCATGAGNETMVTGNVITGYAGSHYTWNGGFYMQDGIQVACENALVQNNTAIDASDVGIIMYYTNNGHVQKSQVMGNKVVNTGNSAYAGVAVSAEYGAGIDRDFAGSALSYNILWTSNRAHMDLGVMVGCRACTGGQAANTKNPTVQNNQVGLNSSIRLQADEAVAVSGAYDVNVTGNGGWFTQVDNTTCPNYPVVAAGNVPGGSLRYRNYPAPYLCRCVYVPRTLIGSP